MTSSVDGLVSGLSTSSMISQLMQVEAAPQTRLKSKVNTAQTVVASYQSVNSRLSSLKGAGDALSQLSSWRAIKATSTSATVTATAVAGTAGTAGTTTFNVTALAKSQISTAKVDTTGDVTSGDTITVTIGPLDGSLKADGVTPNDTTYTIDVSADKSAKGIADALNAKGIGVKAAVVTTGGAQNILQFSGTKTGSDFKFSIDGFDPGVSNVAEAGNAQLQIGGGEDQGGYNVSSSSNTFTGLMPGVTMTVSKLENDVTVTATQDVDGLADKFQALVDAANNTLAEIGNQTAYDASTNRGSPLTGDFSVRNMAQKILSTVSQGLTFDDPKSTTTPKAQIKFGSLSQFGVQLNRTGQLSFDAEKFKAQYAADPSAIQQAGIALGDTFESLADKQTTNITSVITGRNNEIDSLNSQISNWDIRLATKREALQKRYSDLEVSLGTLKNQSSWLAGQIAGLG